MTLMISGGGGGGGATALSGLSDVTLAALANGQILQYNSGTGQWENTALTGQLTYKGSFDATAGTPALTNALKGDFYVISVAGTQFGQSWSIGDHLIVNDDMGGVIDNAKIDKIDNTETGLQAVVDDTTPQLGGALDVNGNAIVSAGAGNIAITPDTTGSIVLDGLNWPQADGAANQVLKTDGAGQLSFTDQTGLTDVVDDTTPQLGGALDVNGNAIVSAGAGNIAITPDTTGSIVLDGLNWPQADGAANQVLKTDGAGQLSFTDQTGLTDIVDDTTPQLGGALDVNGNAIVSAGAGNIAITPDTTGSIVLDGLNWPQADGSANQVLVTNGAGQLSFTDQTGLTDVVDDTTPQLGGALDVNGNAIVSAAAGNIAITPDTTGSIVLDGLNWPQADGAANQVLKTDGAGQLSFVDQSGGGSRPNVYTQSASFTIGDGTGTDPGAVTAAELERVYIINNGASAVTVTLPLIAGNVGAGFKLQIKRLGSAVVTVGRNGNDIDGLAADASLSVQYSSLTICCAGGSDWYII